MVKSLNHASGAFLVSRSLFDSEIWVVKPSEYVKTWMYLIGMANHYGKTIDGYWCERGQYVCTYKELTKQLEYNIGFRRKKYHDSFMKHLMKYLRSSLMIDTVKVPRGMIVTMHNYDYYQKLIHYERTDERTDERTTNEPRTNRQPLAINKNKKQLINYKKEIKEKDKDFCPELDKPAHEPEKVLLKIPLINHGEFYEITHGYVDKLQKLKAFKNIDIMEQLELYREWAYNYPKKRKKTVSSLKGSITSWLKGAAADALKLKALGKTDLEASFRVGEHEPEETQGIDYSSPEYSEYEDLHHRKLDTKNDPGLALSLKEQARYRELGMILKQQKEELDHGRI